MANEQVTPLIDNGPKTTPSTVDGQIQPQDQSIPDTQQQPSDSGLPVTSRPTPQMPQQQPQPPHAGRAGIFRNIFEVLAGPQTPKYRINPETGKEEVVAQPRRTGRQLADSIVAGALTGLFSGANQPDAISAAGAGFNARQQQQQQAVAQAHTIATDDYNRHQGVLDANMRAMNNALQYSKLDKEAHDDMVGSFKSQLDDVRETSPDMIKAEGLSEKEAADVKTHSGLDYIRIPDGVVPRLDDQGRPVYMDREGKFVPAGTPGAHQVWDNTYALVDKNAKVNISDDDGPKPWVKEAVGKWNGIVPGANSSLVAGNGAKGQLSSYTAGKMMYQVAALDGLQKELDTYVDRLNEGRTGKDKIKPIDLRDAVLRKVLNLNDILNFQRVSGMSTQPDLQIDALRQKNPDAAGRITALFNQNGDNLEDFKQAREARKQATAASQKIQEIRNKDDAQSVIANKDRYPAELVDRAQTFLKGDIAQSANRTRAEEEARQAVDAEYQQKQQALSKAPDDFVLNPNASSMSVGDLKKDLQSKGVQVPDNFDALYSVGAQHSMPLNKAFPTRVSRGVNQLDANHALSFIHQFINPNYSDADYTAASKFASALADPKTSPVQAADTAVQHLDLLRQSAKLLGNGEVKKLNEMAKDLGAAIGKTPRDTFNAINDVLNVEVAKVVAGTPHVDDVKQLRNNLHYDQSPEQIESVIKSYVGLMNGRLETLHDSSQQYFNRPLHVMPRVTQMMQQYGYDAPWAQGQQTQQQTQQGGRPQKPQGRAVTVNGKVVGYTTDGKTMTPVQ